MKIILIILSANSEWNACKAFMKPESVQNQPYGEYFEMARGGQMRIFLHGGWGKISAAASAQYAIQRWNPELVINIGTCGGFEGRISKGEIVLVERTLVYDVNEQMGDYEQALRFYSLKLDLSWLKEPLPQPVHRGLLLSADRDILPEDIPWLTMAFDGVAADWESGAIAWVCQRNRLRCLILRGVTDLVSPSGGEAYGKAELFDNASQSIVGALLRTLEQWIACCEAKSAA